MVRLRRRFACWLAFLLLASSFWPATASEQSFPFGSELMLDTAPMRGSKRVPMLEIEEDGAAAIDLWCARLRGQVTVDDASITIVPVVTPQARCDPDSEARDATLLAMLAQATAWRRNGDIVELLGATTLRFRLPTN
jgi:heat shock protein HslJ